MMTVMLSLDWAKGRAFVSVCAGLSLALLSGCASDTGESEADVEHGIHHEFSFKDIRLTDLLVGLPGESFYAHQPIPCGLAVGSGPNVTSMTLAGSTAPGSNLKVDLYAGKKVCRTMFFRAVRVSTTYYTHQVYLEHSDSDTISTHNGKPILFLDGTATSNRYQLSLDLGNMRDKGSSRYVGVRGDGDVVAASKTPAPWSNKAKMSFTAAAD